MQDESAKRPTDDRRQLETARVSLLKIGAVFLRIGATTFGGMWAATQKLEQELVHRNRWLTREEQQTLMVTAAVIPAPHFIAFGGMVGFRLRGWAGSIVALLALIGPAAVFVLLGVMFLNPDVLGAPLVPVRRAVGIAIIGLLFGNAWVQLRSAKVNGAKKLIGVAIAAAVAGAAIGGVPLVLAAVAGLVLSALFITRDEREAA